MINVILSPYLAFFDSSITYYLISDSSSAWHSILICMDASRWSVQEVR